MGLKAMKQPGLYVVYAASVRDAAGVNASPGAVLVQDGEVVMAGEPDRLPSAFIERAEVVDRRESLILPAMVNAHTHLELTGVGPRPYDPEGGFVGWVKMVRQAYGRLAESNPGHEAVGSLWCDRASIDAFDAGVQAVGDIASHPIHAARLDDGPLGGVSYLEVFGIGSPFDQAGLAAIDQASSGLQPHAPYSAGPALYEAAARSGRPVSTHLAETQDEVDFIASLKGPKLEFVRSLGRWENDFKAYYGNGLSPVQWMRPYLEAAANDGGWLVAHCNYVSDEDIAILADTNTSVAYCPTASEYFGHQKHRYREMLAAGVNVCLGTDSIIGTDPRDPQPLGLLSALRRLYARDQTDPELLLAMATTHGAKALRMNGQAATLQPGAPAKLACLPIDPARDIDPLVQIFTGQTLFQAISFELNP